MGTEQTKTTLNLKDLTKDQQVKARELMAKAQERFEMRIAKRITHMVEREQAKSDFEKLVGAKLAEIRQASATIKTLRSKIKQLKADVRAKKDEFKAQ